MSNYWQYVFLKKISSVICKLSYSNLQKLGKLLGPVYAFVAKKQRLRAISNIKKAYGIDKKAAQKICDKMFTNLALNIVETFYMPRLKDHDFLRECVKIEGMEHIHEAIAEDRGVIVLTAHAGNWEWMGARLAIEGYPTTTIVKNQPNVQFTRFINEYREMVGLEVFARDGSDIIRAAKALKRKKILGFLADQDGESQGIAIKFLNQMSSAPLGPATFAKRFKSPVLPIFIWREESGQHVMKIYPAFHYEDDENVDLALYKLTKQCIEITEEFINEHPESWIWFQHRWKTPLERIINHEKYLAMAKECEQPDAKK